MLLLTFRCYGTWIAYYGWDNFNQNNEFILSNLSIEAFSRSYTFLSFTTELELRFPDLWITNQFLGTTNQKFVKLSFQESLFPKCDKFKIISAGSICLYICLESCEWDWIIKKVQRMIWLLLNYIVTHYW